MSRARGVLFAACAALAAVSPRFERWWTRERRRRA